MGESDSPGSWTPFDRDLAVAFLRWQDSLCVCGHPRDEVWTREADHQWDAEIRKCRVCAAVDVERRAHLAKGDDGMKVDVDGMKVAPIRRTN